MIVDQMHEEYPELLKDQYWEEVVPKELPYTVASECYRRAEPKGSADHYKVKEADSITPTFLSLIKRKSLIQTMSTENIQILTMWVVGTYLILNNFLRGHLDYLFRLEIVARSWDIFGPLRYNSYNGFDE